MPRSFRVFVSVEVAVWAVVNPCCIVSFVGCDRTELTAPFTALFHVANAVHTPLAQLSTALADVVVEDLPPHPGTTATTATAATAVRKRTSTGTS
jgi:hypothetical protein